MFKIGDKVKNINHIGTIVDIKEFNGCVKYLIKYPIFTFKNPFKRKLWTSGLNLEVINNGNKKL